MPHRQTILYSSVTVQLIEKVIHVSVEERIKPVNIRAPPDKDFSELVRMARSEACKIWNVGPEDRIVVSGHIYDPSAGAHIFQTRLAGSSDSPGSREKVTLKMK